MALSSDSDGITIPQSPGDGTSETVDWYISQRPDDVRAILQMIRGTIRSAAPEATEKIAWHMPSYWQSKNLINFAAFANHVSIFPGSEAITAFADKLTGYTTGKGTVQFQLNEPIPYDLIFDIVRWRAASVQ